MNREKFFAQLDQLTPKEIEAQLPTLNREQLVLLQEYFAKQEQVTPPQAKQLELRGFSMSDFLTERTIASGLIALGLVLAALILRGGYEVAASGVGAYVVNRFTARLGSAITPAFD